MERTTVVEFGLTFEAGSQAEAEGHVDALLAAVRQQAARPDRESSLVALRLSITGEGVQRDKEPVGRVAPVGGIAPVGADESSVGRPAGDCCGASVYRASVGGEIAEEFAAPGSVADRCLWQAGLSALAHAHGLVPSRVLIRVLLGGLTSAVGAAGAAGESGLVALLSVA